MRYSALTDIGLVRSNNEDSLYAGDSAVGRLDNLFIVADGMGGHVGGEYASAFVVSKIPDLLEKRKQGESISDTLLIVTDRTNKALYQLSRNDKRLQGMGSTMVMASIEGGTAHVINVGDSRLYHFDGTLTQVTKDHSMVDEMVAQGKLTKDDPFYAANKNMITRAMGVGSRVEPDYFCVSLGPGSRLLLCSDGLSGMVDDDTIAEVLANEPDTAAAAEKLMALAKEAGGKDNITVIVIDPDIEAPAAETV
ncbi:MAG: Stp1/IreP family PP2C-type Ser/Thr phosphatase [Lachnospiraceae bacterium]|nr:Stp1/IreP family PP2C-type Ser/Thr phosphatase [Lachnospiraceae bacterium]